MADDQDIPSSISFHWRKSNYFRVIHADGAFGGLTPDGNVFFTLYSDHPPIPDETIQSVMADGTLGQEVLEKRVITQGVERELEVSVVMPLSTAKALRDWLDERIRILESLNNQLAKETTEIKR